MKGGRGGGGWQTLSALDSLPNSSVFDSKRNGTFKNAPRNTMHSLSPDGHAGKWTSIYADDVSDKALQAKSQTRPAHFRFCAVAENGSTRQPSRAAWITKKKKKTTTKEKKKERKKKRKKKEMQRFMPS